MNGNYLISIEDWPYEAKLNLMEGCTNPFERQAIFDQFTIEEKDRYMDECSKKQQLFESKNKFDINSTHTTVDCTLEEYVRKRGDCMTWEEFLTKMDKIMSK